MSIIPTFRWACGESTKDEVDIQSVESAICLSEWIEKSFQRVMAEITSANMPGDLQSQKILSELPNEFETSDVKEIVKINKFMCERSVANWLDRMVREAYIESVSYSKWRKKLLHSLHFLHSSIARMQTMQRVQLVN